MGYRFITHRLIWYILIVTIPIADKICVFRGGWNVIYLLPLLFLTYMLIRFGKPLLSPPKHYEIPDSFAFVISFKFVDVVLDLFFWPHLPGNVVLRIAICVLLALLYLGGIAYFFKQKSKTPKIAA